MMLKSIVILAALTSTVLDSGELYDALVIGGGPAGTSGAMGLARMGRKIVLFDSKEYRFAPTLAVHNTITDDGCPPLDFVNITDLELATYPDVETVYTKITSVENVGNENLTQFVVSDGTTTWTGRKLLLATGVHDIFPVPGWDLFWGRELFHCAWCAEYEHRNNSLGCVGNTPEVISNALNAVALNAPKITIFTNGPLTSALNASILKTYPAAFALLAAQGIPIDQRTIVGLEQIPANAQNETILMVFSDGSNHTTNSLLWRPQFNQTNSFARDLGLQFNTNNLTIMAAANGSTSVKGVYSAGDASSNPRMTVSNSIGTGNAVAFTIVGDLAMEDAHNKLLR